MMSREKQRKNRIEGRFSPEYRKVRDEVLRKRKEKRELGSIPSKITK